MPSCDSGKTNSGVKFALGTSNENDTEESFRLKLRRYIKWHAEVGISGQEACARVLVWTCEKDSGSGDQVRGALHALMLAMETNRYLVLDPDPSAAISIAFSPEKLNWTKPQKVRRSGHFEKLKWYDLNQINRAELTNVSSFSEVLRNKQYI